MRKILVIKLSALGDFIQSCGPMAAIRKAHKDDHITLLTTAPFESLAQKSAYFDDIWIDKRPKIFDLLAWIELRSKLNTGHFKRVYDLQNNDRTNIYFKLFSPKPEWNGIAKGASHQNTNPSRTHGHAFYGHKQTLAVAKIDNVEIDPLTWMDGDISHIKPPQDYILLVPGCAPGREGKQWPTQHYAALTHKIKDANKIPVILGTQHEEKIAEAICKSGAETSINLVGKTNLYDIATLARQAHSAIGNDTGPMHIIAATGCKTLTLFSQHSDPKRHYPIGHNTHTLQEDDLINLAPDHVWNSFKTFTGE